MFLSMFCTWQALWFPNLHHIRFGHPVCAALAQSSGTQPSSRCIIWVQWIPIAPHPRQNILKKWCANHSLKLCGLGVQYIDIKPGSLHLQDFSISVWQLLTWKSSTNNNISIFWVPVQHKQVIWGHLEARTQLSYDKKFPNNFVSIVASIMIYFWVNRKWWLCGFQSLGITHKGFSVLHRISAISLFLRLPLLQQATFDWWCSHKKKDTCSCVQVKHRSMILRQ